MITIVLECIDRLNVYNTAAHFSEFAGEEAAESWKEIVNLLYELLGRKAAETFNKVSAVEFWGKWHDSTVCFQRAASLIRGNRSNCALFCDNLDWLVSKLDRLEASSGIRFELIKCM